MQMTQDRKRIGLRHLFASAAALLGAGLADAQDAHAVKFLAGSGALGSADGTGAAASFGGLMQIASSSTGDVYVADIRNYVVRKVTQAGVVTTFAGTKGVAGDTDGPLATATFRAVYGVALDPSNNVYVYQRNLDDGEGRIRKISTSGTVSTIVVLADYTNTLQHIAVDRDGNVYAVRAGAELIRISPAGVITPIAGAPAPATAYGFVNGTGAAALFMTAQGIALDSDTGDVFLADALNFAVRKVTSAGVVTTFAGGNGPGTTDGAAGTAQFGQLHGLTRDAAGNLFVGESSGTPPNATCRIRRITATGTVSTLSGRMPCGYADGAALTTAKQGSAVGLTVTQGRVDFADSDAQRIRFVCRVSPTANAAGPGLAICPVTKTSGEKAVKKSVVKPKAGAK